MGLKIPQWATFKLIFVLLFTEFIRIINITLLKISKYEKPNSFDIDNANLP